MDNYLGVFKRYERKYLVTKDKVDALMNGIKKFMQIDQYGKTTICNIYYDTPDFRLIRTSIEKPIYKEKLRLRTYGVPDDNTNAFLEIKKKYKGIVYKRRIVEKYAAAFDYLNKSVNSTDNSQISKEIAWLISYYKRLKPAMFISYERTAFNCKEDSDLRITLDTQITYRSTDLDLRSGVFGEQLLNNGDYLMEIKIPEVMPLWLSSLLDELKIYPVSFSKYGTAYTRTILQNKKEVQLC